MSKRTQTRRTCGRVAAIKRLTFAEPERLETRTLLSGSSVLGSSAWYGESGYSIRSLLASYSPQSNTTGSSTTSSSSLTSDAVAAAMTQVSTTDTSSAPVASSLASTPSADPLAQTTGQLAEFTLKVEDLNRNPISTIQVGQDFVLEVDVQDIRNPANDIAGLFASYLNVTFDNTLASVAGTTNPVFGSTFSAFGSGATYGLSASGTTSQIQAGSFSSSLTPPGSAVQELYHITVHAGTAGLLTFSSFFDGTTGHDTIFYDPPDPLPAANLKFNNASVTITSGSAPVVSVTGSSVAEGNSGTTNLPFTISLSSAAAQTVTVNYATADGTATTADSDYQQTSGVASFSPGVTSIVVNVPVNGDTKPEADETFSLVLSAPTNAVFGVSSSAVGTIINDDLTTASVSNVTLAEGNSGTTAFVFTVSLSAPASATSTVAFSTADGTATVADNDYQAKSGTLTFAPGSTSQLVTVLVNGDLSHEANETFSLNLSNPSGLTLGANGIGTINDDDPLPTISVSNVSQNEGNSGTTPFVFTVSLSTASGLPVTVSYSASDGTATVAGGDYQATSGSLSFAPGVSSLPVTVLVNGDTTNEPNETFTLSLSNASGGTISPTPGIGTIVNDDGPHISFVNKTVTHAEGDSGQTAYVFEVSSGVADPGAVTVAYTTQDGTAKGTANGSFAADYTPTSGTLTFAPNSTTNQFITVLVNGDLTNEADETFSVVLSNPTNATLVDTSATGVITNDDSVQVGFAEGSLAVAQPEGSSGGLTPMLFTVTLSNPSEQTITVQYADQGGTATKADNDYDAAIGTLTFAPGVTSQVITVNVHADTKFEADENFSLILSSPTIATLNAQATTAVGTIINDDGPPTVSISAPADTAEGTSATNTPFVFTISLSAVSGKDVTVAYSTADGTATVANNDYVATSGTATIAAGSTSVTITVPVVADSRNEADETFSVNLTADSATNATIGTATATAKILNDDPVPTVSVSAPAAQNEGTPPAVTTTPFVFTVTLSGGSSQQITVAYATADGTGAGAATAASGDYQATSGTLTFAPDTTALTQLVTVLVNADTLNEANETFRLLLSNPSNTTVANGTATATILNDDSEPTISISNTSAPEGDSGLSPLVFTVSLSAASGQTVTVAYATSDNTATLADNDYQPASGTLTFAPGTSTALVTVNAVGDLFLEPDETFFVNLTNATNATISTPKGTGTILNDPGDSITFTPSSLSGFIAFDKDKSHTHNTGDKGLGGVSVTLSGTSSFSNSAVNMHLTTAGDGSFTFGNLDPGTYTVTFAQPSDYEAGAVFIGSQGGTTTSNSFTTTIGTSGGVTGTENDFLVTKLTLNALSQRNFLASSIHPVIDTSTPSSALATITSITGNANGTVNAATATNTVITGTGAPGGSVSLVATNGTSTTSASTATVDSSGNWTISGFNVAGLLDGTITYRATVVAPGTASTGTKTAVKDATAPAFVLLQVTSPLNSASSGSAGASGTGEAGATVNLTATDGTHTATGQATVAANGTWSISGLDFTGFADGTVTYTAKATDSFGNTSATSSLTSTKNTVPPTAVSILAADATPTAAGTVHFTVTFSEAVTGVDISDFSLVAGDGITGASIASVSGSGTTYTVTVNTGSGSGTLGLNLVDDDSIIDATSNPLAGAGSGNGNITGAVYTIDRTAPTVTSIVRADADPTTAESVHFTVTFSEAVTGVDTSDFALAADAPTGASITSVSGSGTTYTVTVGTGTGSGPLGLNLVDDDSIVDALSNPLGGTGAGNGNFTGEAYTVGTASQMTSTLVDQALADEASWAPNNDPFA